jgi:CRP-like cAMP-binding protein
MKGTPRLVHHRIEPINQQFSIQAEDATGRAVGRELILDPAEVVVCRAINGERGLREMDEHLRMNNESVGLSRLVLTLQKLKENGLLSSEFELDATETAATTGMHFPESRWSKEHRLLQFRFRREVPSWFAPQALFFVSVAALLGLAAFALVKVATGGRSNLSGASGFLQLDGQYHLALPILLGICFILSISRSLFQSALIALGGEALRDPWIGFRGVFPAFGLSPAHMECRENRFDLALFGLTSGAVHLSIAGLVVLIWPESPFTSDLLTISVVMTLLELNPYRAGDLTRTLRHFYQTDEVRQLIPFLRHRAFFSQLFSEQDSRTENRLLVYSSLATAWTIVFLLFAQNLLLENWAKWWVAVQQGDLINSVSATVVAALLLSIFAVLLTDLLRTVSLNLLQPARTRLEQSWRKMSTRAAPPPEPAHLRELLETVPFLSHLSTDVLLRLAELGRLVALPSGRPVMIQGEAGNEMALLVEGQVEVFRDEPTGLRRSIARLEPGSVFGEQAVFRHTNRTATVLTTENSVLLFVSRTDFERALRLSPDSIAADPAELADQLAASSSLSSSPLFRDVPSEALSAFVRSGEIVHHQAGHVIVREGDRDDSLYIIIRGSVSVSQDQRSIATLPQGNCFGEIAVLTGAPRNATVTATGPVCLLRLSRDIFWKAITSHAGLAVRIETLAAERSRTSA